MTQDELLALIDQAERKKWKELDLSDKGLTELPPEIGRLTQLEKLDLSVTWKSKTPNQLTHLPTEIGDLNNLLFEIRYSYKLQRV